MTFHSAAPFRVSLARNPGYAAAMVLRVSFRDVGYPCMNHKIVGALILFVAQLLVLHGAQAFPDRPIKWVVSSPAGGPPDIMARLLSDRLAAVLGQPVVIENRTGGASGTIG